jgi:CMP-N,N'-diacetyllegionaminic acid synthase
MYKDKKILAIIPARGGSKGLPGKNKKLLQGKPLVAWPIDAAKSCKYIDKVLCTTDSDEIQQIAINFGAVAPFLRPEYLASDTAHSVDVIIHAIEFLEKTGEYYDYIVLLEPTSPLTTGGDVEKALEILDGNLEKASSIVGICKVESTHPEYDVQMSSDGFISPYAASSFKSMRRRQDLEPLYFLEGSLYISTIDALKKNRTFYHDQTMGFPMPRWKSVEIDEIFDFIIAETILNNIELMND